MPFSSVFGAPLALADGPQLLLDSFLVEDRIELTRVLHHPVKYMRNPILECDKPWEGDSVLRPQVIRDPEWGMFRMWTQCVNMRNYHHGNGPVYYIGYAESRDGFHWTKPELADFPFGDAEKTNIVYSGNMADAQGKWSVGLGQVFRDEAEPDPQQRYKMLALDGRPHPRFPQDVNTEPSLLTSADGLHWKISGTRPILDSHSDTANHVVYDADRKRWLLYCRPPVHASGLELDDLGRHPRRRISVMTSPDFVHWSYPRIILYGDERDLADIDHCCVFRYGSHFLMLYAAMDGDGVGRMHMRLASSSDGIHWERFHTREDFLPLGTGDSWDAGIIGPSCPPVALGERLLLYYIGGNIGQNESYAAQLPRMMGSGLAWLPADRFVAQRAGDRTGYLLTREFLLEADELRVNLLPRSEAYRDCELRVEVLRHPPLGEHADYWYREKGYSYAYEGFRFSDCLPIRCDSTCAPVCWKEKKLAELKGKPVYLRFRLKNMDLFSFRLDSVADDCD